MSAWQHKSCSNLHRGTNKHASAVSYFVCLSPQLVSPALVSYLATPAARSLLKKTWEVSITEWNVLGVLSRIIKWFEAPYISSVVAVKHCPSGMMIIEYLKISLWKSKPKNPTNGRVRKVGQMWQFDINWHVFVLPGHMVDDGGEVGGSVELNWLQTLVIGFHHAINTRTVWVLRVPILDWEEKRLIHLHIFECFTLKKAMKNNLKESDTN